VGWGLSSEVLEVGRNPGGAREAPVGKVRMWAAASMEEGEGAGGLFGRLRRRKEMKRYRVKIV
jgi:hypothetical protein